VTITERLENEPRTDKHRPGGHSYGPTYDRLIGGLRDEAFRMLEIGVLEGGSVAVWHRYFHRATIHAIDFLPIPQAVAYLPRVEFLWADAYSERTVARLGDARFRVIIDDAQHDPESQSLAYDLYSPLLVDGGIYIIEDIIDVAEFLAEWGARPTPEIVDLSHGAAKADNRIAVVRSSAA